MLNTSQPLLVQHPLVRLARLAVETYVRDGRQIDAPANLAATPDDRPCGVFVTLLRDGAVRGSVGTLRPLQPGLAAETIANAIGAAVRDPRFSPLRPAELHELSYVVDLVGAIERVNNLGQLDPARYGLSVRAGRRHGVVLPNVNGIVSPAEQRGLALRKGGIAADDPVSMERFTVQRLIELSGAHQVGIREKT